MSTSGPIALGIDVGTTFTKVAAVAGVRLLGVASAPTPRAGSELASTLGRLIREAIELCPTRPDAVGIASMAETGLPLDAADTPLTPLLRWQDAPGSSALAESLASRLGSNALFCATGVRVGPKPPLIVWLGLRANSGAGVRMARWSGVADWAHLLLTGRLRTDHTLAGRTMAYRLPSAGEPLSPAFDADLLAEAGLTPDQLPHVGLPGEALDRVSEEGASWSGLAAGTPVLVAGHDHQVGAWAAGVRRIGDVADSIGTAEAVLTLVGASRVRGPLASEGFSLVRTVDGITEAVLAGSPSSGAFLQWCADRWEGGDVGTLLAGGSGTPRADLARDSFLLPYPSGRQCPFPDPTAIVSRITGGRVDKLEGPGDVPVGVAAIEAVCYQAQWLLDRQRELAGLASSTMGQLTVIGEPIRKNPLWQGVKGTLARTDTRLTEAEQFVAVGAAMLALARAGLADATDTHLATRPLPPLPGLAGPYRDRLAGFIAAAISGLPPADRG